MTVDDKRKFRRYIKTGEFPVTFRNRVIKAKMVDYSLSGVGLLIEGASALSKGDFVEMEINDLKLTTGGEVVWSCIDESGLRLGVRTRGTIRGSIHDFSLSDTLIGLNRNCKTGVLTVESGRVTKKVYFSGGEMIFSASNSPEDRLGDMLLESGRITQVQFDRSVVEMKKTGLKQGAVLVRLGFLKPQELVESVRRQVERIIMSLFTVGEGRFDFRETTLATDGIITLKLSPAHLLYYGIRQMDYSRDMLSEMPEPHSIPALAMEREDLGRLVELDACGSQIIDLIDRSRTLRQILELAHMDEREAVRTIYALYCAGIIVTAGVSRASAAEETAAEPDPEGTAGQAGGANRHPDVSAIIEMHERYREAGFYGVLGISSSASAGEVRKAYYKAAKKYHPDRHFSIADAAINSKLSDIFSYVYEAYATLTNPARRDEYDKQSKKAPERAETKPDQARQKFNEGLAALRTGQYREAELLFGQATYFKGDVAEYQFHYGLALLYQNRLKPAVKALERAISLDSLNPDYHTELGMAFLNMNFPTRARGLFEKALKIAPDHKRAVEGMGRVNSIAEGE